MTKKNVQLDYVTKDYKGFLQLMKDKIPLLAPEWTDTSDADMGIVILELLSYGLDILSYYQDKAYNESFLATAETRKAVINACKTLAYTLQQQQPSKFIVVFKKLEEYRDRPVTIREKTLVGTDPSLGAPIAFEVEKTITIPEGKLGNEKDEHGNYTYGVEVTQGRTVNDVLGNGNGKPFQTFKLNHGNVLVDTIKLWTEENGLVRDWKAVNDFLSSTAIDRHFLTHVDELNQAVVEFGDGLSGAVIPNGVPLFASYRVGGGKYGNVGIKAICAFLGEEVVGIESLENPEAPIEYGTDIEDIQHAKIKAPQMMKTNDRAVTVEDFEAFTTSQKGISKAKCIETFNENGDLKIYIANEGHTKTSQGLKDRVKSFLEGKMLINNHLIILDAEYKSFDVSVNITAFPDHANEEVKNKVTAKLQDFLNVSKFDFGEGLRKAYMVKELMMMDEILDVEVTLPTENLTATDTQILKVNNITVNVSGGME